MNCQKVSNRIIDWLREKQIAAGVNGFVVGVSGGVDSALVATLCARTGLPTLLVSMPCQSNPEHTFLAEGFVQSLKNKYNNVWSNSVELTQTFSVFESSLYPISELARVNLKSRIRMCTLYALANTQSLLVVGTGNKVEDYGVGFFTKYGDGGVDLSPIGDLLKSEVRELARYLKDVPEAICSAAPTDGLWQDGRTDEDALGATYDELEWAMNYHFDDPNISTRKIKVLNIYDKWHSKGYHKMNMPPICNVDKE